MQWQDIELPTNRKFGTFLAIVCAALVFFLALHAKPEGAWLAGAVGATVALLAWRKPELLHPLNKAWMTLGLVLGLVVAPVVLGVLFLGLFTPLAVAMRLAGRDELRLRRAPAGASYWRVRNPPGPAASSFARQF
jgi:hypothetical protein